MTTDQTTMWALLEARAARSPDALFVVDEAGRRLTYSAFLAAARSTAEGLVDLGIGSGVVVSWVLGTSIDTCVVMAALSRLSVVQVPIVPIYRAREIGHIVVDSAVDVMLVGPSERGVDYGAMVSWIAAARGGRPEVILVPGQLQPGRGGPLPPAPGAGQSGDVRWHFYTSGSTGKPKGAQHSDGGLIAVARGMAAHMGMGPTDRSGLAFPIAHVGGPINVLASFISGAALILLERFDPERRAVATLRREGVTMAGSGTAFHLAYLDVQRRHGDRPIFPALRCCPGGGAPKPPGLHHEVKACLGGAGILSGWRLTEAPVLTMGRPDDPDEKLDFTEGRPLPGVELRVTSADGTEVVTGEPGELRVRAPQMMHGYVDARLNVDAFDEHGFIRTGDLGLVDHDGFLTITGRLKDVVIRNGENIGAAEVEELVRLHPDVADAVVVGLSDARTGERLCAIVELRPGHQGLDVARLAAHLEVQGLRRQAWPEQVEVVGLLPRTATGKVDKSDLVARLGLPPAEHVEQRAT